MIYIVAFFFPYIALAVRGMFIQAIFNFLLEAIAFLIVIGTLGFGIIISSFVFFICSVWSIISVSQKVNKERHKEMIEAIKQTKYS